jgi:hypothetical protein
MKARNVAPEAKVPRKRKAGNLRRHNPETGSSVDPSTWQGFLHRAIDDRARFVRLCVLLVLTTAAMVVVGLFVPDVLTMLVSLARH